MTIDDFCVALGPLNLSQPEQAVAILWFADSQSQGKSLTAGEITKLIRDSGLGTPHSTRLGEAVMKSRHALKSGQQLRLKPTSRDTVAGWVKTILEPRPVPLDHDNGFIPKAIWHNSRGYLEKVAAQVNGCYEHGFYDGASVLTRRLIETLLIECYEHLGVDGKIKSSDGNYPMLSEIIVGAVDKSHLPLGRETKRILHEIKTVGDRSAHNRRYTAVKADLDKLQSGVRLVVDELIQLSELRK